MVLLCAVKSEFCTVHFFFFWSRPLPFIYLKACPAGSLLFSLCFCSVPSVCPLHLPKHSPSKQTFEQAHLEPNTVESQILTLFGLGRVTVIRLLGAVDRKVVYDEGWLQGVCALWKGVVLCVPWPYPKEETPVLNLSRLCAWRNRCLPEFSCRSTPHPRCVLGREIFIFIVSKLGSCVAYLYFLKMGTEGYHCEAILWFLQPRTNYKCSNMPKINQTKTEYISSL